MGTGSATPTYLDKDLVVEAKTASTVPIRDSNGDILVATTPTAGDAAASKTYVDDSINYLASDDLILANDGQVLNATNSYVKLKEIKTFKGGTIRVKFDHTSAYTTATVYARIYINGVAVGTERSGSTEATYVTYSQDFTVVKGDLIQLYLKGTGTYNSQARNFRIYGYSTSTIMVSTLS